MIYSKSPTITLASYFTGKVPGLAKYSIPLQRRRAYRCQSTRSRLRSLNENKSNKDIYPRSTRDVRRVQKTSEISVIEESDHVQVKSSIKKRPKNASRSVSVAFETNDTTVSYL